MKQATVVTPHTLTKIKETLPKSWLNAIGILRNKQIDTLKYQKKLRGEWEERSKKTHKSR
jgi:hypothetical protein